MSRRPGPLFEKGNGRMFSCLCVWDLGMLVLFEDIGLLFGL